MSDWAIEKHNDHLRRWYDNEAARIKEAVQAGQISADDAMICDLAARAHVRQEWIFSSMGRERDRETLFGH